MIETSCGLQEELMARLEREQSKHAGHLDQRVQLALQLAVQLVCYFSKCSQISLKCGRLEIITFKIIEIELFREIVSKICDF